MSRYDFPFVVLDEWGDHVADCADIETACAIVPDLVHYSAFGCRVTVYNWNKLDEGTTGLDDDERELLDEALSRGFERVRAWQEKRLALMLQRAAVRKTVVVGRPKHAQILEFHEVRS